MPKMVFILWSPLHLFCYVTMSIFFLLTYFIKPFEKKDSSLQTRLLLNTENYN